MLIWLAYFGSTDDILKRTSTLFLCFLSNTSISKNSTSPSRIIEEILFFNSLILDIEKIVSICSKLVISKLIKSNILLLIILSSSDILMDDKV